MSFQRILSVAALLAATFVFVDSASSQPRAPQRAPAAASAAGPMGMHGMTAQEREQHRKEMREQMHGDQAGGGKDDGHCMGMMGKHQQMAQAQGDKDHRHGRQDRMAAAGGMGRGCGMDKMH